MSDDQGRAHAPKRTLTETWFLDDFVCRRISWCIWKVGFVLVFAYTLWGSQGGQKLYFLGVYAKLLVFIGFYRIHQELWRKAKVPCGIKQFPRQFSLRGGHWTFLGVYANALAPTPSPPKAEPSGSQFPPWGGGPPSTANWKSNSESHQIDRRHRC